MAAVLGSSAVFLDSTIVNVALPRIGRELPVHVVGVLEGQSYVYTGYLLTLSALLIPAGALGDHYGRRTVFQVGLVAFGLTSALCGLAVSMEMLIVSRVLQGAAGALLVPGSLALIRANFEGEDQGRAIGIWSSASAATTLLGPLVGGLLVDMATWRLAFLINLPLVLVAAIAVRAAHDHRGVPEPLDWTGAVLAGLAVGGLSFGIIYGQQHEWRAWEAYAALLAGAASTVALPLWLQRASHPLVPLELFRSRNFNVVNVSTLLIYGALYVLSYYQALFLQGVLGYTAAAAGLTGIPISLALIFLSTRFGTLAARSGPRLFMTLGPLAMALGLLWLTRVPSSSAPWRFALGTPATYVPTDGYLVDVLPAMVLFALGIAALVAPLTTALMTSVPESHAGVGSALNNALSRVGPQLAGAAIFVAVSALFYAQVGGRFHSVLNPLNRPPAGTPPDVVHAANVASTNGFHLAMAICIVLLLAGAAVNWFGVENRETT